jgi:hypothetical protein
MSSQLSLILICLSILLGSAIIYFVIFGAGLMNARGSEKLETLRNNCKTLILTIGVLFILGAFSLIIRPVKHNEVSWTTEQKDAMVKKIMESSIFVHGIGSDTARLISECFINKYTSIYTPMQMREQNKLTNEQISKLTNILMTECLKNYGLPMIDTSTIK